MPRYFFDFNDTENTLPDDEGVELADLEAAKDEAVRALAEITRDLLPNGSKSRWRFATVVDIISPELLSGST
jgi:two-component sensor histidine kinase